MKCRMQRVRTLKLGPRGPQRSQGLVQSLKGHLRLPQQLRDVLLSYRLAVHFSQQDDLLHLVEGLLHSTPIVLRINYKLADQPRELILS